MLWTQMKQAVVHRQGKKLFLLGIVARMNSHQVEMNLRQGRSTFTKILSLEIVGQGRFWLEQLFVQRNARQESLKKLMWDRPTEPYRIQHCFGTWCKYYCGLHLVLDQGMNRAGPLRLRVVPESSMLLHLMLLRLLRLLELLLLAS
jgi:hypothetical protein